MPQTMPHNLDHHTPMMQQYLTLKADYPHALVLYRMGDFYELFFDDAKLAADILGITLTRRGKDKQGNTIPMAGVPFHSADGYIARLINAGQTVVVCEQVEEEKPEDEPEDQLLRQAFLSTAFFQNLCLPSLHLSEKQLNQPHRPFQIV